MRRRNSRLSNPQPKKSVPSNANAIIDGEHWAAERKYWYGQLEKWMQEYYKLPLHSLQSDDSSVPEPSLVNHIQNSQECHPDNHFATGYRTVLNYFRELHDHGASPAQFSKVLEFGVGLGRLIRHFLSFRCDRFGCDLTPGVIEFTNRVLGKHVQLAVNRVEPPLPYADATFDFIYANSVFTHIQRASTDAWIAELRRIIRPGGYLIATVFEANYYLSHVTPREFDAMERGPGFLEWGSSEVRERYMYATSRVLRDWWGRHFDVLEIRQHLRDQSHLVVRA